MVSRNLWELMLWFNRYLLSRTQWLTVRGHLSDFLPFLSSVTQGSIFGPLLFLDYINDLPEATCFSTTLIFADDTKCLRNIFWIFDCRLVQKDILALCDHEWSPTSRLQFNIAKFAILRFCPSDPPFNFPYSIDYNAIAATNSHRILGITMSSTLN